MVHTTYQREGIDTQMNIFFYAAQKSSEASEVLHWLESLDPPLPLHLLPSGSGLSSHESLKLRNGDLIVVFVRDQQEMKALIDQRIEHRNYRIYLIFQEYDPQLIREGLLLNPTHYSSVEEKYLYTEETIRKILKQDR